VCRLDSNCSRQHTHFEEIYTFPEYPLSENEQVIPQNGFIDLQEFIGDYLALEIPINPVCKPSCRGLCSYCGQNLNLAQCEHVTPAEVPTRQTIQKQ